MVLLGYWNRKSRFEAGFDWKSALVVLLGSLTLILSHPVGYVMLGIVLVGMLVMGIGKNGLPIVLDNWRGLLALLPSLAVLLWFVLRRRSHCLKPSNPFTEYLVCQHQNLPLSLRRALTSELSRKRSVATRRFMT